MRRTITFMALILAWVVLLPGHAQEIYRTGNATSVDTGHQRGIVLAGGATDNDDAMRWMLQRADGGDVVVLRASGSDGYNEYFYRGLGVDINSVTSIVIRSRQEATSEQVLEIVEQAEVVFLAGGNQWNYINYWQDTPLQGLLNELINQKKITLGGTSAGMAVLGQVAFSAENNTVWSSEALGDCYHWRVMLERDFLDVPYLENTVTDTHYNREESDGMDRKGRHVAFLARMINDWHMPARGVAANEYTAIAVDEEGKARVFGNASYDDDAWFLQAYAGDPEGCGEEEPLHWDHQGSALMVYRVKGDRQGTNWFSLSDWVNGRGGQWHHWHVEQGTLVESGPVEETGWIQVQVRDASNQRPLKGATVLLSGFDPKQTPSFGTTNFRGIETSGSLSLRVTLEGYKPFEQELFFEDKNLQVEVMLVPEGSTHTAPAISRQGMRIFPNPSCGPLILDPGKLQGPLQLHLFSPLGPLIRSWAVTAGDHAMHSLPVAGIPAGTYLLKISGGSWQTTKIWIRQ